MIFYRYCIVTIYLSHMCAVYHLYDKPMFYHMRLYQILLVGTTFDTVPKFNTSITLLSKFVFENDKYISWNFLARVKHAGFLFQTTFLHLWGYSAAYTITHALFLKLSSQGKTRGSCQLDINLSEKLLFIWSKLIYTHSTSHTHTRSVEITVNVLFLACMIFGGLSSIWLRFYLAFDLTPL